MAKRHKGTFRYDGNVLYLDYGDSYTGILSVSFMFIVHKLYPSIK